MPAINLTTALKNEYLGLFDTCSIRLDKLTEVDRIVQKINNNKSRYELVGNQLAIPWYIIAVIHNMESSLNFDYHLHNGDPLTARTVHVPSGRPISGSPPFTWEESAVDSLKFQKMNLWKDWSLAGFLFKIEEYNGWGYRSRHPEVLSPYLWSGSNHYVKGKYVADGRWSDTAVSNQIGAAVLIRRLAERNLITITRTVQSEQDSPLVYYSTKKTEYGEVLQQFLNQFPDIYLLPDGKPGKKTSNAFKRVTGYYLSNDPRA
jgi:lysozyme family protein